MKLQLKHVSMNMRQSLLWILAAVTIIAIIVGLVYVDRKKSAAQMQQRMADVFTIHNDDHIKGDPNNAKVVLIEYSDFQCPACARAYEYFKDIEKEFPEGVVFIYRHFPLALIHRNAVSAARAAEAAAKQGHFEEMHNLLFEKQDEWHERVDVETLFADYAESLGMNREQFLVDYKSAAVKERVDRDSDDARMLGLSGTPTLFVNGKKAQLPRDKEALYESIRARLSRDAAKDHSPEK